jgi:hypothetical protein
MLSLPSSMSLLFQVKLHRTLHTLADRSTWVGPAQIITIACFFLLRPSFPSLSFSIQIESEQDGGQG